MREPEVRATRRERSNADPAEGGHDPAEETPEQAAATATPVVGVGASAGGLEAFKLLLSHLPPDTGFALVLIQHLDPKHHSMLSELLGRASQVPVTEAADGMAVEPNRAYVIPPNSELTIANRVLRLTPRAQTPAPHLPIDQFLRSLAEECGSTAVGVILSGTGTDGAAGLQAIKEAGGVTFAQDPATAEFPSMPRAAEGSTCVDFVLSPERIAEELGRLAKHPYLADSQVRGEDLPASQMMDQFQAVFKILRESTGIDFSLYRQNTMHRRILRRMALLNIDSTERYVRQFAIDPGEHSALQRDLLISVTSFFRDPESFAALKQLVFPKIAQNRPDGRAIRIWVPGCATGEEAYSIAISLQEYLEETAKAFPVQIFASDISEEAIERARSGKYPVNIAQDVSPERLDRYFTKDEMGYQIAKVVRERCVFSRHNLIDDPPFAKVDLISCRNVLIYLGGIQKEIISRFHFALNPDGFLFLGRSETASVGELFSIADGHHRIYAKRETARKRHFDFRSVAKPGESAAEVPDGAESRQEVDRILLSKYSPPGVVVDAGMEVIEIRGRAAPYLSLPAGRLSFSLLNLIPDTGLYLEVEKLVHEVQASGEAAHRERIRYTHDGGVDEVNIGVIPVSGRGRGTYLILFEAGQTAAQRSGVLPEGRPGGRTKPDHKGRLIAKLTEEVAQARQRLVSIVEEHRTSSNEDQNATEEALSANEELQSLNEELETAKEELQSANEELITVNQELQSKNTALRETRDFAISIVETVREPLLVLDTELRIHTANPVFYSVFGTSPEETDGRFLYSVCGGSWDIPGLRDVLNRVLSRDSSFRDFEVERDFPRVGHKVLVLSGSRLDKLNMILFAIEDITLRREAEKALHNREEQLRQSQKMEAIGRLAGGIAHDFNNLLTGIIGYSDLLLDDIGESDARADRVLAIRHAGERAASLTEQLLAFSRRKVLQPRVLDLAAVVADFKGMLHRLMDERIKVVTSSTPDLWRVRADPGEMTRVLMNLCLNARDAMPGGGNLTIETRNVTLASPEAVVHNLEAGQYVMLAVHDTGIGIDPEAQVHIFEPFFTTKDTGKGTGLGLASVFGIVEQSGGAVWCDSEPGRGSTFNVALPAVAEQAERTERPTGGLATAPKGSSEVILLVEDEDMVRKLARNILEKSGYVVLEARNGREGLSICETHGGPIHLLLSDVVMPELGGRELAERAAVTRPAMRVLFMSGHTHDVVLREGISQGQPFLQKPFMAAALARKVREVLDSQADS